VVEFSNDCRYRLHRDLTYGDAGGQPRAVVGRPDVIADAQLQGRRHRFPTASHAATCTARHGVSPVPNPSALTPGGAAIGRPLVRRDKFFLLTLLLNRPNLGAHSDRLAAERGGGCAFVSPTHWSFRSHSRFDRRRQ